MESSSECGKNKLQNLRLMGDRLSGKGWSIAFLISAVHRATAAVHSINQQCVAPFA